VSDTTVSLLTPPGTAAIAVIEARGPLALATARALFSKALPESLEVGRFWFGTLAGDEVVLAVTEPDAVEVHCHGGPQVVRAILSSFTAAGCTERTPRPSDEGFELLQHAPTLRTANTLLDQLNGAFAREVQRLLALLETNPASAVEPLHQLADLGHSVGRYLMTPWRVVIAGPPNAGKSSLVNALAGFQRSVVSEVPGTTRDAVSVRVAFDGWPVELIDTAGMRDASGLEAEGIARARETVDSANLVVWLLDGTAERMEWPRDDMKREKLLVVVNKSDAMLGWGPDPNAGDAWGLLLISARTGDGLAALVNEIVKRLVSQSPPPGGAVPYTPRLIELVIDASRAAGDRKWDDAARLLSAALE